MSTNPENYTLLKLTANAYAQTNASLGIDLDGSVPFSVDAWVKFNGLCTEASILSKEGVFTFGIHGNMVFFEINGYPSVVSNPSVQALDDETWHYVCVTYAQGQVRIYIDGKFNVFQGISGTGTSNSNNYLIGTNLQALTKNIRVYNTALEQDTVFDNMYGTPVATSIVVDFDFSVNPPKDNGSGNLPIALKGNAKMVTNYPAMELLGTAYAKPIRDEDVNPGGYQTDSYTVQAWVYINSNSNLQQHIFINDDTEVDSGMALYLEYSSLAAGFQIKSQRGSSNDDSDIMTSTGTVPLNTWTNIATTFNGTTLSIYINGALDSSKAMGPIPKIQLESNLLIGASLTAGRPSGSHTTQGYIARVDVWNTALTAAQLTNYMNAMPSTSSANLQAVYSFTSSPARNLVNGHPIGLTDGAKLSSQISAATSNPPSTKAQEVPETNEIDPALIEEIRNSLDYSDFMEAHGDKIEQAHENHIRHLLDSLPESQQEKAIAKANAEWEHIKHSMAHNPKALRFSVTDHVIDGQDVLLCHTRRGSYVAYQAPVGTTESCTMWKVRLVFIVIAGILDAFFGVSAKLEQKVVQFITTRVLPLPALTSRMAVGGSMSALIIFQLGRALYDAGLLKDLVRLMMDLGWWALFRIIAKLVLKLLGIGAADVLLSLAATVASFIKIYTEKPEDCYPLPKVVLAGIKFNYDATSKGNDALNIRKNYTTPIDSPEWLPSKTSAADSQAAYAIKETTGKTVNVQVKFTIDTTEDTSVQIQATGGGILGAIDAVTVNFKNGVSDPEWVTLPLNHQTIAAGIKRDDISWAWQYKPTGRSWSNMATSKHRIYTVLESPSIPWTPDAPSSDSQLPWTDVLDYACVWADGKTTKNDAATAVTTKVNGAINLTYDTVQGASKYTNTGSSGKSQFLCTSFLELLGGGTGNGKVVNCTDCATIVATFANSLGCNLTESTMYGGIGHNGLIGFGCNKIIAIGGTAWAYPFPHGSGGGFSYHEVAWTTGTSYLDEIYDACLQLDSSTDPWADSNTGKVAKLPANVVFTTQGINPTLPIATPFSDWDYRERLATNTADGIAKCIPQGPFDGTQNGRRIVV